MIPRIRGKAGQATSDDPKFHNKWFFTMWLTEIGGGEGTVLGEFGPFETEEIAKSELDKYSQIACEAVAKHTPNAVLGKYIDMKDNKVKSWKKD